MPALKPVWRPMIETDLDAVAAIAVIGFPDHFEGRPMFANRLGLAAEGCFVLVDSHSVQGYLIAYPWRADAAPPLDTPIETIPDDAGVMYLHDLCLHPDARGLGATGEIVERLASRTLAEGWPAIGLVAVNHATRFWARHGFTVRESHAISGKLAGYGPDARYMIRPV